MKLPIALTLISSISGQKLRGAVDLSSFFKLPNAPKSQFFNLKQGITLTLTSDAVDNEFCDPNSDVSLAGYMNGEGANSFHLRDVMIGN